MIARLLAVLLLLAPALAAAQAPREARPPAVTVAPAMRGTLVDTLTVTGTVVPREEVLVSPQVEGLAITDILADEGDRVASGQVLARLSRDMLETQLAQNAAQSARAAAAISQAQSSIAEAEANRLQADAAFGRARELLSTGSGSRENFENKQQAAGVAVARLAAARDLLAVAQADQALAAAQRQELAVRLARTEIRAPVGGVVSRRVARLGAVVAGAGDPLFRIIADGAVELEGDVPEALLVRLRPGQPASVTLPGRDTPLEGKVRLVSPEVGRQTRLGRVRLSIGGSGIPIGGFGRATVEVSRRDGVQVPLSAVMMEPDGARVQVVQDATVQTRRVKVGLIADDRAEIMEGVAEGEQVVAVAGTFVRDGDRVAPVPVLRAAER
ncbi:MAG: efflux RND transporter periplasmic adaptor subunit [Acetobacteraceae bacterium]|nr:efflux RND transporter periplasmic adaptor subunit [Acetobacteraceae bacterium]